MLDRSSSAALGQGIPFFGACVSNTLPEALSQNGSGPSGFRSAAACGAGMPDRAASTLFLSLIADRLAGAKHNGSRMIE